MIELEFFQGKSFSRSIAYTMNGVAMDITNFTIYFTVKSDIEKSDSEAVIDKTLTKTNAAGGIALLSLSEADTTLTIGTTYYCDIQAVPTGSGDTIVTTGIITVSPCVRKD